MNQCLVWKVNSKDDMYGHTLQHLNEPEERTIIYNQINKKRACPTPPAEGGGGSARRYFAKKAIVTSGTTFIRNNSSFTVSEIHCFFLKRFSTRG
jgi:hypothetical protein